MLHLLQMLELKYIIWVKMTDLEHCIKKLDGIKNKKFVSNH